MAKRSDGAAPVRLASALLAASLLALFGVTCPRPYEPPAGVEIPGPLQGAPTASEAERVRRVAERRCVVCHACYDAPCQLVLTERDGLLRGANKDTVYRSSRLRAAQPTRLGLDARTVEGWRKLGFFSVTEPGPDHQLNLLVAMLALGRSHTFEPDARLPDDVPLGLERELTCPQLDEMGSYAADKPKLGMPYGMAPLADHEYEAIASWAASDAPVLVPVEPDPAVTDQVAEWERELNDTRLERRVVARYLFEHWVFADLHFSSHPAGPFFQVVRSRTPPGEPIEAIATRFPYDHPGVERFWYRLQRVHAIIAHKSHITYRLGPERLGRLRELFFGEPWKATRFPSWDADRASNPFVSFDEIPARARYQFLLDDALYFVRTFIRGPVCRGQAATDVIQDRFFISFLDPDHDASVQDPSFLARAKEDLLLPAEAGANMSPLEMWSRFDEGQNTYRDLRADVYKKRIGARGATLDLIWDGDGRNENAMLTVLRNHDNAMVVRGWVGAKPKTAWVIDYPIFERIYYNLVAGFDVFGNVAHQLAVRIYMDNLRMESESTFLVFLPNAIRSELRASWYEGATDDEKYRLVNRRRDYGYESAIRYHTSDPMKELLEMLLARDRRVSGPPDTLNRCTDPPCDRPDATDLERQVERELQRLPPARGRFANPLPEVALLRVRGKQPEESRAYTLVHDRAHTNVAEIFREETRYKLDDERVTVMRGVVGSYPNFAFDVDLAELPAFVDALLAVAKPEDLTPVVERWGVRRSSPRFWQTLDWFQDELVAQDPLEAGTLDLNRYRNL